MGGKLKILLDFQLKKELILEDDFQFCVYNSGKLYNEEL